MPEWFILQAALPTNDLLVVYCTYQAQCTLVALLMRQILLLSLRQATSFCCHLFFSYFYEQDNSESYGWIFVSLGNK